MSIATPLQTQVQALQARIESLAPSATPEDVVMLAKAVEAVAGQATVFDVLRSGEAARTQLNEDTVSHRQSLQSLTRDGLVHIQDAQQAAVDTVLAAGYTLANLHAISLVF